MNIAKQREIMALQNEAQSLAMEYQNKKAKDMDLRVPLFLDAAIEEFTEYLEAQGFTIHSEGDEETQFLTADSGDGIIIHLNRKPRILTIKMPNGERYSVMIESTLEEVLSDNTSNYNQDSLITYYKKTIETTKKQIAAIASVNYRYVLSTEPIDGRYSTNNRRTYLSFTDVLSVMFK
jgi:hypothetical protein